MSGSENFKGFEVWFNRLKMEAKMQSWTLISLFALQVCLLGILWNLRLPQGAAGYLTKHIVWDVFGRSTADPGVIAVIVSLGKKAFFWSSGVYLLYPLVLWKFRAIANRYTERRHIRGARLIEARELNRQIKKAGEEGLPLGEVSLPVSAEVKHGLVIGRPGAGKTVCLSAVIETLQQGEKKGIIYDFKGDYVSRFFREGVDQLFNPLDVRSVDWNIFNDIKTVTDIEAISHSLIPPGQSSDTEKYFSDAARAVLTGLLRYCINSGKKTNGKLWKIVSSPVPEIAEMLRQTPGGEKGFIHVQDGGSKQAMGVHSTLMQYAQALEYMPPTGDFSVSEWLKSPTPGFLFVSNCSDLRDTLRPVLSLLIDLISRKLLAMPDNFERRFYLLIDEFGTLQRLSSIIQLLTLSRSKGGSVWLGIQDVGQIDKLYGRELRQSISNACGTSIMFSVSDPETAKFLSDKIGEREISEVEESQSMGPSDMRDGLSLSRKKKTEKLLLPSEFLNLPDLEGYLKIPGYDVAKTIYTYKKYKESAESVMLRSDLTL